MTFKKNPHPVNLIQQSNLGSPETSTLRYQDGYNIADDNDLITKEYLASEMADLIPPPPDLLSTTALTASGFTLKSGYLAADPTGNFDSAYPVGSLCPILTRPVDGTLTLINTTTAFRYADTGTLSLLLNGVAVESHDLTALFDENLRLTSQTYPVIGTKLKILSVSCYKSWRKHQRGTLQVNLASADLRTGNNTLQIRHVGSFGVLETPILRLWVDKGTSPIAQAVTAAIKTPALKHLSGIPYYTTATLVTVGADFPALLDASYVANPVSLSGNGFTTLPIAANSANWQGVSTPPSRYDNPILRNQDLTLSVADKCGMQLAVTATPSDPFGAGTAATSPMQNMLFNTFTPKSTALYQHAADEVYRLPLTHDTNSKATPATMLWDSTAVVASGSAIHKIKSDNLFCIGYPTTDYSTYKPLNTANYAGRSGTQSWLRWFKHSGSVGKSSIQLVLKGVSSGIGTAIFPKIKLPTQTDWLDATKLFGDGNGCLAGSISYSGGNATLNITFGTKSTVDSGFLAYLMIDFANPTVDITEITTNWS